MQFLILQSLVRSVEGWKDSPETNTQPQNKSHQTTLLCHPGLSGSSPKRVAVWWGDLTRDQVPRGWQSPFATETGGLFQTGNSVASAERTSAAQKQTTHYITKSPRHHDKHTLTFTDNNHNYPQYPS